jgi:hypothetical protein
MGSREWGQVFHVAGFQKFDPKKMSGIFLSDFSVATRLGDGDGNVFGMDIKAQIQYYFAYCLH